MSAFKDSGHHWWQQCDACEMAWFVGDEPCDGEETEATCKRCDTESGPGGNMTCTHFYAEMATPGWRECIHCGARMAPPSPLTDPTTAEAFAILRECVGSLYGYGHRRASTEGVIVQAQAERTLALLERRMRRMWSLEEIEEQARVVTVPSHPDVAENVKRTLLANLALIRRPAADSPPLAVLVEAFCRDVEASERAQEAKRRGGQQVPFHGPFFHLQPSARGELNRWARDFREALKK